MAFGAMFKPTTFGKFYLYEKLAIGGMAEIFKAKLYGIAGFEKTLVVKQILPEYANDNEFVKMFIDEANIAVSLTHGNIVPVYELGKIGDRYYIAMEFVDGENLETIIDEVVKARQEIPVAKAVEICIEMLKGLDYAHKKQSSEGGALGIVHRDISPQNIMVSFDGEVKIVDFGIAKAASKLSLTRVGTLKGKFGYMSPEQAAGTDVDRRTDVYAAGIVLWEILTGKRLYDAENDVELLRRVRAGQAPPPRQVHGRVPEALDRLVVKALAREVGDRYQEAAQFQLDLQRWLYSRPEDLAEESLANWMRNLFKREMHPRSTPVPPPVTPPPPTIDRLNDDRPTNRSRRDVSFARNSEILRVLEQAEDAAARDRIGGVEPTTAGVEERSVSTTGDTAESADAADATRSQSISGDYVLGAGGTATSTASAGAAGMDDLMLEWDENTDKTTSRRPGEGEYVERSIQDGPIIRVPTVGRRREMPAPWQAGAVPARADANEETRPPAPRVDRKGIPSAPPPPGPGSVSVLGIDATGDTKKPGRIEEEPPLFAERKPLNLVPYVIGGILFVLAAVGGFAIVAFSVLGGSREVAETPKPSPTITSFANNTSTPTRTARTATPPPPTPTPAQRQTPRATERPDVVPVNAPAPAMGKISVQSTPWGEVSIDGVKVKNTPLIGHAVRVGTRKVSVFCPSLKKTETRVVVVRANEQLDPLIFNFE